MATFNNTTGDVTLGVTGTGTTFVVDTRIWAGGTGTFQANQQVIAEEDAVVTADSCTIKVQAGGGTNNGFWAHGAGAGTPGADQTGGLTFSNVQIQSHGNTANASTNYTLRFTDVTWVTTGLNGQATFGAWTGSAPLFVINGFNVWFNPVVSGASTGAATGIFFPGVVDPASQLNGISLWNRQTGDGILGAALTFRGQAFAGLQSGPIGFVPSGGVSGAANRVLYRCESVAANQVGLLLGYDYRGIHDDAGSYVFGADNGGNHWIINPLQGTPTGALSFGNVFSSATASTAIIAVGNEPVSDAGNVVIVNNDPNNTTMYAITGSLSPTGPPSEIASDITELSAVPFGVAFSNQIVTVATGGFTATAVDVVTDKSYRTYSWQQQDWGDNLRTISVPAASNIGAASDAIIDGLRTSGAYPDINTQDRFVTTFDINEDVDAITAGFASPTAAVLGLHGTGRATNARDAVASIKAAHYTTISTSHVPLVYTVSGLSVNFGGKNLSFADADGTPDHTNATLSIPTTSLVFDAADTVTELRAADITVAGTILNNTDEKATLIASGVLNLSGTTVQNLTSTSTALTLGTGGGSVSLSSSDITTNSINGINDENSLGSGNSYQVRSGNNMFVNFVGGLVSGQTYSAEDLLGEGYTINTGTTNITITSSVPIFLATSDANVLGGDGSGGNQGAAVVTKQAPLFTAKYRVPADLRNGTFAVRNTSGTPTTLVAPVVVDGATAATYEYDVTSANYNGTDAIRIYWRPNSTATNGYNTRVFNVPTGAVTANTTTDLEPNPIVDILWQDVLPNDIADDVGTASMTMIENGDQPALNGVNRAELQYINAAGILDDPQSGAVNSLYVTITALNDDTNYLERMVAGDLTTDYIVSSGAEALVDGMYCYLDSADANVQTVTAVTNSNESITPAQFIPNTFATSDGAGGIGSTRTVVVIPNPLGATPGQIAAAVTTATTDVKSNQAVLLTATQRGAVKAATYSAGTLIP